QGILPARGNAFVHRSRLWPYSARRYRLFPSVPNLLKAVAMAVYFHEEDLPAGVLAPGPVAVDTETMGLVTARDRLCVVQISDGKGDEHLVRFGVDSLYDAPNLKAVLADPARTKLFHFARFDLAAIQHYLGVMATPGFCAK